MNHSKDILYQSNQSIDVNKSEHTTDTLSKIFHKPVGEANPYVLFEYGPHKICEHNRRKVSVSMNAYLINSNK